MANGTDDQPPPPLFSAIALKGADDDVTIEVGETLTRYRVSKTLLCHYSEYFRNALKAPWKEAEEKLITLSDVKPQIFGAFIQWLYTQQLPQKIHEWAEFLCTPEEVDVDILKLELYVLADRFIVPSLRRGLNRRIIIQKKKTFFEPDHGYIIYAFNNLPASDPILTWIVDRQCAYGKFQLSEDEEMYKRLPREFLLWFFQKAGKRLRANRDWDPGNVVIACDYHGHETEEERRLCVQEQCIE